MKNINQQNKDFFMKAFFYAIYTLALILLPEAINASDFYKTGGKRVDNIYNFTKYYLPRPELKREFILEEPVSDAWAYTLSGIRDPEDTATYKINGKIAHVHKPNPWNKFRGFIYKAPISGFKKGKNELIVENVKKSFMIVIHLASGKEVIIEPDDKWLNLRGKKWVKAGKAGIIPEKKEQYHGNARPYGGLIEIETPSKKMPVFKQGNDIRQQIIIPKIFYGIKKPLLSCEIENCWTKEKPEWGKKDGITGTVEKDKIIYNLELSAKKQGAYTITYSFGPKEGHKRRAELIVIGKIDQKKVPASKLFSSLKKKLVTHIKCGDPKDSHRFVERGEYKGQRIMEDTLVLKNGKRAKVRYRETGNWFSHASEKISVVTWDAELKNMNKLHVLEYDYPDNRDRVFTVGVVYDDPAEYFPEATEICGGDFPLSGELKTGRLIFYSRTPHIEVLLANKESGRRGAVANIRIYEIEDSDLPMADIDIPDGKLYMAESQRGVVPQCVNMYPGTDYFNNLGGFGGILAEGYDQYRRLYLSMRNFLCYTRFCGENGYMPSSTMFSQMRYPCAQAPQVKTDGIGLLEEMFAENDMKLVLMSHYFTDMTLLGKDWKFTGSRTLQRWIDANLKDIKKENFADPVILMDKNGKSLAAFDPSHPDVRKAFLEALGVQLELYGNSKAFKGITVFIANGRIEGLSFISNDFGYGDGTMQRFKQQSKVKLPDFKGEKRFAERYKWIAENEAEKWENFKCATLTSLMGSASKLVAEKNSQAQLFVAVKCLSAKKPPSIENSKLLAGVDKRYKAIGCNLQQLKKISGLVLVGQLPVSSLRSPHCKKSPEWNSWRCYSEELQDYRYNGKNTGAILHCAGYENHLKWPAHPIRGRYDKSLHAATGGAYSHYLHQLNVALAGLGASYIFTNEMDCNHTMGHELYKAEFAETFSLIPLGDYKRVDGSNQNIIGRVQANENPSVFYVSNLKSFDTTLEISFEEVSTWKFWRGRSVIDLRTGKELPLKNGKAAIKLGSYETKIFKCVDIAPSKLGKIIPDEAQVKKHKRQKLKSDRALEISARVGDNGQAQLFIKNTGDALEKDFIKITRHDNDKSLENTKWTYGPLKPGEEQIITIPGKLKTDKDIVEGIVHTPNEIFSFRSGGRKTLYAEPCEMSFTIDGKSDEWKNIKAIKLPLNIRDAGMTRIRSKEEIKKFPEVYVFLKAAWKKDGLCLLFEVPDKKIMRNKESSKQLWSGDSIGIFLDLDPVGDSHNTSYSDDDIEFIFAPADGKGRKDEMIIGNAHLKAALAKNPELLQWKSTANQNGYAIEIKLANKFLKEFNIYPGKAVGFDVRLNALDPEDANKFYANYRYNRRIYEWHNKEAKLESHGSTKNFGNLVLKAAENKTASPDKETKPWKDTKAHSGEILYCNDFENGLGKIQSYQKVEIVKRNDFMNGANSLKAPYEKWKGKRPPIVRLSSPITVETGKTYCFSAWVYSDKNAIGRIDFSGGPHTGYKNWWTIHKGIIFKRGWNKYSITKTLEKTPINGRGKKKHGGEEIKKITPVIRFYQKGTYFIDDFKVKKIHKK